jgi:hypothetical protein
MGIKVIFKSTFLCEGPFGVKVPASSERHGVPPSFGF